MLCCYFSWNLHFVGVAYRQSVFLISPHTVKLCVCIGMSNVNMNVDTACVVCIPFWILSAHTFLYPSPALVRHKKFNRPTMCVCILRYEIDGCKTRACDSPNGGNSLHRHRWRFSHFRSSVVSAAFCWVCFRKFSALFCMCPLLLQSILERSRYFFVGEVALDESVSIYYFACVCLLWHCCCFFWYRCNVWQ